MKNIYQHNIELEPIRINNADKATFSQKLIDLPYRGYEVEELSDGRKIVITKPGGKSVYGRPKKEDFLVFIYNPNDNTLWQISHKQILEDVINKVQENKDKAVLRPDLAGNCAEAVFLVHLATSTCVSTALVE